MLRAYYSLSKGSLSSLTHHSLRSFSSYSNAPSDGKAHFGFSTVKEDEKVNMVKGVFHSVANKYDVMNDLMSAGLHRIWKDEFVRMAGPLGRQGSSEPTVCLDVAGGTGDIAFRLIDSFRNSFVAPQVAPRVIVCDINSSMLAVGEERARARGYIGEGALAYQNSPILEFVDGNAESLQFPDNSVDLFTIAFGIRNVTHIDRALEEAYRVLKPGGRFMCLEFSHVRTPGLSNLYDLYSFNVIPAIGQAVTNDRDSYQYLVESIRKFPNQDNFAQMIADAGFRDVRYTDFTFGVCAVHSGFKF